MRSVGTGTERLLDGATTAKRLLISSFQLPEALIVARAPQCRGTDARDVSVRRRNSADPASLDASRLMTREGSTSGWNFGDFLPMTSPKSMIANALCREIFEYRVYRPLTP